jgi:hypothetical protein
MAQHSRLKSAAGPNGVHAETRRRGGIPQTLSASPRLRANQNFKAFGGTIPHNANPPRDGEVAGKA